MPYTIKKVKNGYKVCKKDEPTKCFSKEGIPEENAKKQMKAIVMNEIEGGLKPLTARIGGKVLLKKKIVDNYFPKPDSYTTYIEPFVGGGSIYFYKNKDNHNEVVNDIDPDLYTIFKGFQKYSAKKIADDVNGDYTEDDFENIVTSKPTNEYAKFLKVFLKYRLSFFGRGTNFGKPRINSNFKGYEERLKDTQILNVDYKDVIKKYNKPSSFFYLDPPARESTGNYRFTSIDIPELIKTLKTIKGKFLLSIANIDVKKEVFRPFKIITVPTKYVGRKTKGGQTQKVKEYLIMNYEPKMEGGMKVVDDNVIMPKKEFIEEHERLTNFFTKEAKDQGEELKEVKGGHKELPISCNGCMGACGGAVSDFQNRLNELGIKPELYLKKAKESAKHNGYDPSKVIFCTTGTNKLEYESPNGQVHYGNPDYNDYIIYSWLEHKGEVEKGTADKRRELYRARATNIKGNWKKNKYSPNNLAINILW
jgi:DNA adenine methylase